VLFVVFLTVTLVFSCKNNVLCRAIFTGSRLMKCT
jgi:hypothetical protein